MRKTIAFRFSIPSCALLAAAFLLGTCSPPPKKTLQPDETAAHLQLPQPQWKSIDSLRLLPISFNPSQRESVTVSFRLKSASTVTLSMIDEDGYVVRRLMSKESFQAGATAQPRWDGRDDKGDLVPDEVYFPLIFVTNGDAIDTVNPIIKSGGEKIETRDLRYDAREKAVMYSLDLPARMLARVGIKKGAMFSTVTDMKPRLSGKVSEYWNGRDADDIINVMEIKDNVSVAAFGYTLPQPCVVTYGNAAVPYRAYREKRDSLLAKHFAIPPDSILGRTLSLHFRQPRILDHAPAISLSFLQSERKDTTGATVLKGKTIVRVAVDPADARFLDEQYEITFFLDNVFFTEEEVGYMPYNMVWDLSGVTHGAHILTVNVSSFKDRIGVKSARVVVE